MTTWLLSEKEIARGELVFLESSLARLASTKQSKFCRSLERADESEAESKIFELLAHELLSRLALAPEFDPQVGGKTPDLSFTAGSVRLLADVFVTHSPSKTVTRYPDGLTELKDTSRPGESRALKIAETIATKITKYASNGFPLVLIVFVGDRHFLDEQDTERALFGMTLHEVLSEPGFPLSVHRTADPLVRVPVGGLLLPGEDGHVRYENLSAVITCDWFDTLNRADRGKRLFCRVLHNYAAAIALPHEAFSQFPQALWSSERTGTWTPQWTHEQDIAARFVGENGIECRPYSCTDPW